MRFSLLKKSGFFGLFAAGLALAGCNGDGDSDGSACVAGQVDFCPCPGDTPTTPSGMQTCLADGTYGACVCDGGTATATDGETDSDSDSSNNSDSDSATTSGPDLCGNGFPDPGECTPGPDGGVPTCPEDCQSSTDTDTDSDTDSSTDSDTDSGADDSSTGADACAGVPIYVAMVPSSASIWTHPGFGDGFTAGTQACIAAGADGVCTYTQMVEADAQGDFAAVPQGTTYWVHRIVATMFNGMMIQPDTRSRCDDWRYATNDVNDGEFATVNAGALTFSLDVDPNPNGGGDPAGLDCGPLMRAIPCCNVCVP